MQLDEAPVYSSLTTKSMVLGLPHDMAILLGLGFILFIGIAGISFLTIGGSITAFLLILPFLRRLFEKEPFAVELLQSYFRWPKSLPHHARIDASPRSDAVLRGIFA